MSRFTSEVAREDPRTAGGICFHEEAWPRPCLLVEADPTGGSGVFAGYFRGESTHAEGLIDLAVSNRQGTLGDDLPKVTMTTVSYTHLRAHETDSYLVCRLLL